MTDREKIIVSAYTGVLMCDFNNLHKYIENILGRPVFTHEMADKSVQDEIKEKARKEFLTICNTTEPHWIPCSERMPEDDTEVFVYLFDYQSPYIAWVTDSCWFTEEFQVEKENYPKAWMPLPEPYKERREE